MEHNQDTTKTTRDKSPFDRAAEGLVESMDSRNDSAIQQAIKPLEERIVVLEEQVKRLSDEAKP